MTVSDAPIRNCGAPDGQTDCPQTWGQLKPSYVEGVRQCATCRRNVYLCRTDRDVALYSALNYCLAVGVIPAGGSGEKDRREDSNPSRPDAAVERRSAASTDLPARFLARQPVEQRAERRSVRRDRT